MFGIHASISFCAKPQLKGFEMLGHMGQKVLFELVGGGFFTLGAPSPEILT